MVVRQHGMTATCHDMTLRCCSRYIASFVHIATTNHTNGIKADA